MSLPACLVTSSPTFEDPQRTPPFLMATGARPDLRQIKVVDESGTPDPIEFAAGVRSEDNGDNVYGHLVLDYGVSPPGGPANQPYLQSLQLPFSIAPGTLDDTTTRTLSAKWYPGSAKAPVGCHTVSLFASHEFDNNGCPLDSTDFDFLTWTVLVCNMTDGSCCDPKLPADDEDGCKSFVCPPTDPNVRCDTVAAPPSSSQAITSPIGEAHHE